MNKLINKIEEWAITRNLQTAKPKDQALKLMEEVGELADGLNKNNHEKVIDSIGDIVVVLTIMCKQLNTNLKSCVSLAYDEIKDRKGKLINGVWIKEEDLKKLPGE